MSEGMDIFKWLTPNILKPSKRDKHVIGCVCCYKCGRTSGTLRKLGNKVSGYKYICNECYKKEIQNG